MHQSTMTETGKEADQSTLTRRLFAGGLLATLAASGIAMPVAAQGLKDVDDDQDDREDEDESGDIPQTWRDFGVTSASTYESPQYGYLVEWETPWTVDPFDPGMTDPDSGLDNLVLKWDGASREAITVSLVGFSASSMGIEAFGDYVSSREYLDEWETDIIKVEERFYDADAFSFELLITMSDDQTVVNWVYLLGVEVSPDAWMLATLMTTDDHLEVSYNDLSALVAVEGESLIRLTTWRDIERAIR